jgi:copper homeostasis protein
MAMIRPRAGGFGWSRAELLAMEADIAAARLAGLGGVVLGASLPDGRLDAAALARLVAVAQGLDLTLHRCFDLVHDMGDALEVAVSLGFRRILTSGGEATAEAGAGRIGMLVSRAAGRIAIMPGGGVTADNARRFIALGATELHGSCSGPAEGDARAAALGFGPRVERHTDARLVRAMKRAMEAT